MDKFKMQLTWHNCLTYPPKEKRNNTLYATDGKRVFDVIYDSEDGWFDLAAHNYIPKNVLHKFWWADLSQTVQGTLEFKRGIFMYGCGCCSMQCERRNTCALSDINQSGAILAIQDYYNYGIGSFTSTKSEILWWCGPHGNWGMYIPLEEELE